MQRLETVGSRLRWAIQEQEPRGKSRGTGLLKTKLKDYGELKGRTITGATYPSIAGYLKDRPTATLDVLTAVAEVLGINLHWLALGQGHPTEDRAEVAHTSEVAGPGGGTPDSDAGRANRQKAHERALRLKRDVLEALGVPTMPPPIMIGGRPVHLGDRPAHEIAAEYIPHWVPPLAEVRRRRWGFDNDDADIGRALRGPLDALGIDAAEMHDTTISDYITAMTPILLTLALEKYNQDLLEIDEDDLNEDAPDHA